MPRLFTGTPFRQKKKDKSTGESVSYGAWRCYDPIVGEPVSLEAETEEDAKAEVQRRWGNLIGKTRPKFVGKHVASNNPSLKSSGDPITVTSLPDEFVAAESVNGSEALRDWTALKQPVEMSLPLVEPKSPFPPASDFPQPSAKEVKKEEKKQQALKFSSNAAVMVTNFNVLVSAKLVEYFGKVPVMPEGDDTQMLQDAWEAQLAIWFETTKVEPYMMIIIANVLMVGAMYMNGKTVEQRN